MVTTLKVKDLLN